MMLPRVRGRSPNGDVMTDTVEALSGDTLQEGTTGLGETGWGNTEENKWLEEDKRFVPVNTAARDEVDSV